MNIKKISEKDGVTKLLVKGVDSTFMNSIRRTVMMDIPVLAIEDISVYDNSSVMFDEYLAHRLGMLPVKTDLKTYSKGDKVKLVLEKEGPCTVYSRDIKCTDPKIEIAAKKVPLLKLRKDQKIKLEMTAVMDSGSEHVKWQPAIISYNNLPIIVNRKDCTNADECVESCPTNVLEVKAKKIVLKDPFGCILCRQCEDTCKDGAIVVDYDPNSFVLTIEPTGTLTVKEILNRAADVLKEKSKEFKSALK